MSEQQDQHKNVNEPLICASPRTSGIHVDQLQKVAMEQEAAKHGLGVITAAIFLAGEMAGSGVLALPYAMIGTGQILL